MHHLKEPDVSTHLLLREASRTPTPPVAPRAKKAYWDGGVVEVPMPVSVPAPTGPIFVSMAFNSHWDRFVEEWAPRIYTFLLNALGPYAVEPKPVIHALDEGLGASGARASFNLQDGQVSLSWEVENQPGMTLEKLTHEMLHGNLAGFPQEDDFYSEGFIDYTVWVLSHAPVYGRYGAAMKASAEQNIKNREERAMADLSDYDRKRWAGGVFAAQARGTHIVGGFRLKKLEGNLQW